MARTKISEFSATPGNNTDIDGINIAEGCAPSGINDAIRELMAQLKDFQAGTAGDSFNGPVGTTTAAAGAFTTLSASSTVTLSGGTANGVPYLNGSKVLTTGSALTFDGTNLGIGTSSPAYKLDITSASDASLLQIKSTAIANNTAMRFGIDGNNSFINASGGSTGVLQLRVFGTTQATLDASGNLGLGVTPSAWSQGKAFEISAVGEGLWGNGLGDIWMLNGAYFNGGFKYSGTTKATAYRQGAGVADGSHSWHIAPSGTAGNTITFTQAMTLDASGNLGLGTTSPYSLVKQDTQISSADTNWAHNIRTFSAGTGDGTTTAKVLRVVNSGNGNWANAQYDAWAHIWTKAGTETARIDSSGNLLVGTTSAGAGAGFATRLAVDYGSNDTSIFKTSGGSSTAPIRAWNSATTTDNTFINFATETSYTSRGSITYNRTGGLVAYNTSSDYRLKENIIALPNALETVLKLKPRQFDWKETKNTTTGFVAHELAEILPHAVTGEKDAVDADGNPVYQGIDTSFLVATLTAAIQEQQAIINQINAKVEAQAAEIAALKGN